MAFYKYQYEEEVKNWTDEKLETKRKSLVKAKKAVLICLAYTAVALTVGIGFALSETPARNIGRIDDEQVALYNAYLDAKEVASMETGKDLTFEEYQEIANLNTLSKEEVEEILLTDEEKAKIERNNKFYDVAGPISAGLATTSLVTLGTGLALWNSDEKLKIVKREQEDREITKRIDKEQRWWK